MPTYDRKCTECNHEFEWICSIRQRDDDILCPECGKISKRVFKKAQMFWCAEGHGVESSRKDQYWQNAEENRLKALKKRKAEHREKMRFDEKYREKELRKQARLASDE